MKTCVILSLSVDIHHSVSDRHNPEPCYCKCEKSQVFRCTVVNRNPSSSPLRSADQRHREEEEEEAENELNSLLYFPDYYQLRIFIFVEVF